MTPDRLNRFARHIVLPEIGGVGQMALAHAHAVVIGCGGIGSPAIQYLASAGVGRITLVDDDSVEASNLQRQTIFSQANIGQSKAEAASRWISQFDPDLDVRVHATRLTTQNAAQLLKGATVILDGSDNFATRLAVSDAAVAAAIPLTTAAVGRFQGQVANFAGHLGGHACYRCFVGDAFDAVDCDTCAADGVLGAFVGMLGTMAAQAAIRVILHQAGVPGPLADPQWGRLHVIDGLAPSLRSITIPADPACPICR